MDIYEFAVRDEGEFETIATVYNDGQTVVWAGDPLTVARLQAMIAEDRIDINDPAQMPLLVQHYGDGSYFMCWLKAGEVGQKEKQSEVGEFAVAAKHLAGRHDQDRHGQRAGGQPNAAQLAARARAAAGRERRRNGEQPAQPAASGSARIIEVLSVAKYVPDEDLDRHRGAFVSVRVKLEGDGYAIRKPTPPRNSPSEPRDVRYSIHEQSAYDVDNFLGIGLTPPTAYRKSDHASFQEFVSGAKPAMDKSRAKMGNKYPADEFARMALLDMIIGNEDRHEGNFLFKNGHVIAIDHGLSFLQSGGGSVRYYYEDDLSHAVNWGNKPLLYKMSLPRSFRDKITSISQNDSAFKAHMMKTLNADEYKKTKGRIDELARDWDKYFDD